MKLGFFELHYYRSSTIQRQTDGLSTVVEEVDAVFCNVYTTKIIITHCLKFWQNDHGFVTILCVLDKILDFLLPVLHFLLRGFVQAGITWNLEVSGFHSLMTYCQYVCPLKSLLNTCSVRSVEFRISTCPGRSDWKSFAIVRISSVYNAWKFYCLSRLYLFCNLDVLLGEVDENYVKWYIWADIHHSPGW